MLRAFSAIQAFLTKNGVVSAAVPPTTSSR
jgi:hypothetical protein